jgi:2-polyprenyl-6-methoxyphenol hydroxylase-like FAD-dependent oxidoreductase
MRPKIAIIGGGIGGLTAAVALARQGLAAEVFEQAPVLEEAGAGVGLWPNALAALAPIGLAGKVAQLAVKLAGQGIKRPEGTWLLFIPGEVMAQRWGAGLVLVHRAELQQLLAGELGPSAIHLGARCTGFDDGGQAVTAYFADGRKVQAEVLAGADGVHSAVRAQLFGPAALRYRGYTAVRSITPAGSVPLPRDAIETWGRGRVALLGDAIHPMSPDLTQGACQAILDATTLATCLAASPDTPAAIRGYQQRRWRNAAAATVMARNMGAMGQWKGHTVCTTRNTLIRSLPLSLQLRQFDLVLGAPLQVNGGAITPGDEH